MPDTTARIRTKGLDATGVTEDLARQMHAHKGKHYMAIVELKVEEVHERADGTVKVDLVLTQIEPATDDRLDEHLRELTRTLYYNRGLDDAQPRLDDDNGPDPKISDVIRDGEALVLRDDDGQPIGLWDGDDQASDIEGDDPDPAGFEKSLGLPSPFTVLDGQQDLAEQPDGSDDEAITDPHTYVDTASSLCALCDQPAGAQLHHQALVMT